MATKWWAVSLIFLTTLLTSTAQLFYKWGSASLWTAQTLGENIFGLITNYNLIVGLCLYAIGAAIMIISFRGGDVTVLYPIFATSYIWVSLLSLFVLGEQLTLIRWIGIFVIIAGISCIGLGSKETNPTGGVA